MKRHQDWKVFFPHSVPTFSWNVLKARCTLNVDKEVCRNYQCFLIIHRTKLVKHKRKMYSNKPSFFGLAFCCWAPWTDIATWGWGWCIWNWGAALTPICWGVTKVVGPGCFCSCRVRSALLAWAGDTEALDRSSFYMFMVCCCTGAANIICIFSTSI